MYLWVYATIPLQDRFQVRQTGVTLVVTDLKIVRRRTLHTQSPNGCLGQRIPYFARPGQYYGEVNMQ